MAASHSGDQQPPGPLPGPLLKYVQALCARAPPGRVLLLIEPAVAAAKFAEPGPAWRARLRQQLACSVDASALALPLDFSALHPRYELCVIYIDLTIFKRGEITQCLARLKNQYCNHIELIIKHESCASEIRTILDKSLFELGFHHAGRFDLAQGHIECYAYELKNYNKKRSWNTPEYWANPQNFDKFRW